MLRAAYFLVVVEFVFLAQESYSLCKRCNYTRLGVREERDAYIPFYNHLLGRSSTRDTSYLPEEDYAEERESREDETQLARDSRNLMPEYRSLCEIVTRRVQLHDPEFEYQPPHYHEIYCKSYSLIEEGTRRTPTSKQKCAHPGFHCVQRSRTLFLVRRRWDSECWEPFTKEIASGCDCMWPVSVLGDITAHY